MRFMSNSKGKAEAGFSLLKGKPCNVHESVSEDYVEDLFAVMYLSVDILWNKSKVFSRVYTDPLNTYFVALVNYCAEMELRVVINHLVKSGEIKRGETLLKRLENIRPVGYLLCKNTLSVTYPIASASWSMENIYALTSRLPVKYLTRYKYTVHHLKEYGLKYVQSSVKMHQMDLRLINLIQFIAFLKSAQLKDGLNFFYFTRLKSFFLALDATLKNFGPVDNVEFGALTPYFSSLESWLQFASSLQNFEYYNNSKVPAQLDFLVQTYINAVGVLSSALIEQLIVPQILSETALLLTPSL